MCFVRYIQLERRTMITPSGRRWSIGLIGKPVNRNVSVSPEDVKR